MSTSTRSMANSTGANLFTFFGSFRAGITSLCTGLKRLDLEPIIAGLDKIIADLILIRDVLELVSSMLPKNTLSNPDLSECSICLEELSLSPNANLIRMECFHEFHPACINTWLENHGTCPNCRHPVNQG